METRQPHPKPSGYSLIEGVVYLSLILVIGAIAVAVALEIVSATSRVRHTTATIDNARRAMTVIEQEILEANDVYTPTSAFGAHPGQLSLVTERNLPANETITYVDFFVQDGLLYVKREGQSAEPVTAPNLTVEDLQFTNLGVGTTAPAVQTTITLAYSTNDPDDLAMSRITLTSTTTLRTYDP